MIYDSKSEKFSQEKSAFLLLKGKILEFDNTKIKEEDISDDDYTMFFGNMTKERKKKLKFGKKIKELSLKFGHHLNTFSEGDLINSKIFTKTPLNDSIITAFSDSIILKITHKNFKNFFEKKIERRQKN